MKPTQLKNLIVHVALCLALWLCIIVLIVMCCTGCAGSKSNRQVIEKTTVFGFQAKTPGPEGTQLVIQFGLVRNFYVSNPTSSNAVNVAGFSSHVDADLTAMHQNSKESLSTLPLAVTTQTAPTNSVSTFNSK